MYLREKIYRKIKCFGIFSFLFGLIVFITFCHYFEMDARILAVFGLNGHWKLAGRHRCRMIPDSCVDENRIARFHIEWKAGALRITFGCWINGPCFIALQLSLPHQARYVVELQKRTIDQILLFFFITFGTFYSAQTYMHNSSFIVTQKCVIRIWNFRIGWQEMWSWIERTQFR